MNSIRLLVVSSWCLLALAGPQPASAQSRLGGTRQAARLNQLDNAKIAFITSHLTLSQDQAQRFWPMYNDFITHRRELNRAARQLRTDARNPNLTDNQLRDNFAQDFAIRQQQLNLEKDYFDRVQKVLSMRQVAALYQAERDFTKEVLKRVAGQNNATPNGG